MKRLSVGEHRSLQEDGRGMEEPANDIRANDSTNAVLPEGRRKNGARRKGEAEAAKQIAEDRNRWIELDKLSKLGRPSVSGDESDNFTNTNRGKVYKRIADDEIIKAYDEKITPEQEALLRGHNFREYPAIQELSAAKLLENVEKPHDKGKNFWTKSKRTATPDWRTACCRR